MENKTKPHRDFSSAPSGSAESKDSEYGGYGHRLNEPVPIYDVGGSEHVIKGRNNSFVVLGRDRNGSRLSGGGGRGFTQCGSIDLIAGLAATYGEKKLPPGKDKKVSPNFFLDAARVYITQKGRIDKYFGLAAGTNIDNDWASAVGIKADHIRVIGRQHVKIVAGKGRVQGAGSEGELNSRGGLINTVGRIDLLAGNYSETKVTKSLPGIPMPDNTVENLQPLVKGNNLVACLKDLVKQMNTLHQLILDNQTHLISIDTSLASHIHEFSTPFAPTSPPIATSIIRLGEICNAFSKIPNHVLNSFNTTVLTQNYLDDEKMPTHINSLYVSTT